MNTATALQARKAISALLDAEGFCTMSRDVMGETEPARIAKYVRVCVKNAPAGHQAKVADNFRLLGLY